MARATRRQQPVKTYRVAAVAAVCFYVLGIIVMIGGCWSGFVVFGVMRETNRQFVLSPMEEQGEVDPDVRWTIENVPAGAITVVWLIPWVCVASMLGAIGQLLQMQRRQTMNSDRQLYALKELVRTLDLATQSGHGA